MAWFLKEVDSEKVLTLKDGFVIGRIKGTKIFSQIRTMSKIHCQFRITGNQVFVRDMNSSNGTFLDAVRISVGGEVLLKDGSILNVGGKKFIVTSTLKSSEVRRDGVNPSTSSTTGTSRLSQLKNQDIVNFEFKLNNSKMFGLLVKNIFFTILTFGLYIPYAKTNMRKMIWGSTSLGQYPFQFTGDPAKLFLGRIKLILIFVGFAISISAFDSFVVKDDKTLAFLMNLFVSIVVGVLIIKLRYGTYVYLVKNSSYRGVNFKVNKSGSKTFLMESLKGYLFIVLTFGLYLPFYICSLDRIKWNNTGYGSAMFRFEAKSSEYAVLFYRGIFLTIITLGLYYPWFMVSLHQFKMRHLQFHDASIETSASGSEFFSVLFKSFLLALVTFGLAAPFVMTLNLTYFLNTISLQGKIDFEALYQSAQLDREDSSDDVVSVMEMDSDLDLT